IALGSVADDRYFLGLDEREIGVLVVISLGHSTFLFCTEVVTFIYCGRSLSLRKISPSSPSMGNSASGSALVFTDSTSPRASRTRLVWCPRRMTMRPVREISRT